MRIARRCRRCAARAVVAVDARADTDANCASHRVLQHVDNSLAVDNAMRVAQTSVLLAQFGVSFDPFGGAKSRVTVSAYRDYREVDYRNYRLKAPPRGYHYVKDNNSGEIILAAIATGIIASILAN